MAAPPTTPPATAPRVKRLVKVSSKEEMANKKHNDKGEEEEEEMRRLRGEVEALRREVERLLRLNTELECHKSGLAHQLTLAHCTITQLQKQQQQQHDIQIQAKTIISDLSQQRSQKEATGRGNIASTKPQPPKPPSRPPPPPPPPPNRIPGRGGVPVPVPPPPPLQQGPSRISTVNKATALVEMYNSLTKRDAKRTAAVSAAHHNSIVGELQNRSTHLLAIKADVETKGEFINDLIKKVHTTTYTDVEQVLTFVDWLDQQLSTLSDETAVLKHFSWPERKADALREAAFEYRDLNHVLTEISSLSDDDNPTSCEATLRKTSSLLDKLEKSMNRLVNLRSSAMPSYKELRIPTDWMLDSGIASKMRLASVKLAKVYMKRALKELDRDTGNEAALVAQSVRFTYRVHQFAGGLDSEAMRAFEELRQRVRSASSP